MDTLGSANLCRVTGLLFMTVGVLLLAKVVTSHAHMAATTDDRLELSANRRHVGMWFCIPVLLVGLQLQLAGEFFATMPESAMVLALLGLALWLLAFLLVEDLVAERMLDNRKATEVRRQSESARDQRRENVRSFYRYKPAPALPAETSKVA